MIGRRRPNRVFKRSDHAPTSGGTVMANTPPRPSATPMAVFRTSLGTTSSTWAWIRTVVSGIQRKLLPNQNALSAVCCRFRSECDADGGVPNVFGDNLIDLGLDQNGGQRNPKEVAAEPERAERGVLQVPVMSGRSFGGEGRGHGRKAKLSRLILAAEKR